MGDLGGEEQGDGVSDTIGEGEERGVAALGVIIVPSKSDEEGEDGVSKREDCW